MRVIHGLSALAVVAWASLAFAQVREVDQPARPAAGARPATAATTQAWTADQQIAACLHNCCRNEVEISKFALERLESNEARQFAEQMIAEHTAACEKLAKFAGGAVAVDARLDAVPGATPGAARRDERREDREERREERREEAAAAPRAAAEPARGLEIEAGGARVQIQPGARPRTDVEVRGGAAGGLNWVAIHKQIADQCLASTKQELGQKKGAEFEKCYLGGQIMGHMKALDEIKVLRNYASPELRAELDACSQHCAEHLKEAKVLAHKLEGDAPRVSRRPDATDATEATKPE